MLNRLQTTTILRTILQTKHTVFLRLIKNTELLFLNHSTPWVTIQVWATIRGWATISVWVTIQAWLCLSTILIKRANKHQFNASVI